MTLFAAVVIIQRFSANVETCSSGALLQEADWALNTPGMSQHPSFVSLTLSSSLTLPLQSRS